jgi:hypothetical protein
MNRSRRQFIRTCAAGLGASGFGPRLEGQSLSPAPDDALTNWAGNYRYSTRHLSRATSVDEVRTFVRTHAHLCATGQRKSASRSRASRESCSTSH